MRNMNKHQLVIATWPTRSAGVLGGTDYRGVSGCDSFWIELREVVDKDVTRRPCGTTWIGLWVWLDDRGNYFLEPRAHDVFSLTLSGAEVLVKAMRVLCRRMPARQTGQSFEDYLVVALQALRITSTIEYRPNDTRLVEGAPVGQVVAEYERRLNRLVRERGAI
jgi:hypothetical protein